MYTYLLLWNNMRYYMTIFANGLERELIQQFG